MTRHEPDPQRECRPGGSCPECNPPPRMCPFCGDNEINDDEEHCSECSNPYNDKGTFHP